MQELNTPSDRKLAKKRPVGLLVAIAIGGIALMIGLSYYAQSTSPMDYNYTLMLTAKMMNLSCPDTVSKSTRLDSVSARRDKIFTYYFTFLDMKKDELDSAYCEQWEENLRNATMPMNQEFGEKGVTVVYKTRDKNGVDLCEVSLSPKDYYKPPIEKDFTDR